MADDHGGATPRSAAAGDTSTDGGRRLRWALAASLAVLVLVRLLPLPAVFQGGSVVLQSNDPYYYRYWVDLLHGTSAAPWDLPAPVARGEPLFVVALWLVSLPVGGSQWATGVVLAWYPVVAAVLTGYLVYRLATRLSGDPRVGLAAVLLLAVAPAHASRTSLGFADHHAFDYLWLTATGYLLTVLLGRSTRDRRTWLAAGALAVCLAGQVLAWAAGPLLVLPFGLVVATSALAVVRRASGTPSPLVPVVAGVGGGAGLVLLAHVGLGWHTTAVVASVALLSLGSLAVHALTEAVRHAGGGAGTLAGLGLGAGAGGAAVWLLVPVPTPAVVRGVARLTRSSRVGEVSGLGAAFGPVLGPLVLLGFAAVLAVPGFGLAVRDAWRCRDRSWLPVLCYTLVLAGLAVLQRRFAGELAPFLAVLGGLGLVWLLARLDLVRPLTSVRTGAGAGTEAAPSFEVPDRTRLALLGGIATVVLGAGTVYTRYITSQVSVDPGAVRAARWMRAYAADRDWTFPDSYVFTEWDRSRAFNYLVNGRARSYGFARRNYEAFLFATSPETWYDRLEGRVGFVVTRDLDHVGRVAPDRLYTRLHRHLGSAVDGTDGLGHFRAVYAGADGRYKVFTLVPGATLAGRADRERVRVSTTVDLGDTAFEYAREAPTDADGRFAVTVAHPGRYTVGDETVVVSERAVSTGERIVRR
jgi:dolichyl-diphosphooligosaccharide--protein glycosyltransferase